MNKPHTDRDRTDEVRLTLLDGVEAHHGEHRLVLGPPQRRALLCALVFRREQWVTAQTLLDALYEDDCPASGTAVVQTHVAGLRRVLEPGRRPRTPSMLLPSAPGCYRLNVAAEQTDLGVLDRLVTEAEAARNRADLTRAHHLYGDALRLFSGEPLAGVPGPYAARRRDALVERRLALLEDSLDVTIALGLFDRAINRLRVLIAEHPLRERLHALLMRALHLHDRQSEALDAYTRVRRLMKDELGLDPSQELRALHSLILSGQPVTAAPGRPEAAPRQWGAGTSTRGSSAAGRKLRGDTGTDRSAVQVSASRPPASGTSSAATGRASAPGPAAPQDPAASPPAFVQRPLLGRGGVLAQTLTLVERAATGHGGLVVVSGAPGHGKTRFLEEVGLRVPYALRLHAPMTSSASRPLGLVEDILRHLGHDDHGILPPVPTGPHADEEIAELVCRAAPSEGSPLVILADDPAPAGERSSQLLAVLSRRLRTSRVLLVVTVDERHWDPEATTRHSRTETAATALLRLGPLDPPAVAALSTHALGAECPPGLSGEIHRATGGVPLLVVALLTDLVSSSDPCHLPSHLPGGCYSRALAQMLERYSDAGARMLRALAVLQDGPVPVEVLAAACAEPERTVRERCGQLAAMGILAAAPEPAFAHPLAAGVLRRLTSPQEATEVRVAAAEHARARGRSAREVAHHLRDLTGEQWSAWAAVLGDAADECLRDHLPREAAAHLETALRIVGPHGREAVLLRLGHLEMWSNPAAALARLEETLRSQRARRADPSALIPLAWTMAGLSRAAEADALVDEVIAETGRRDPGAALRLRASSWMIAALTDETWPPLVRRLRAARAASPAPRDPVTEAVLTWDDAFATRCSAQEALSRFPAELAAVHDGDRLPPELFGILVHLAMWSEDLCLAWQLCGGREDRYFGSLDVYWTVLRSEVLLRRGEYRQALAECALVAAVPLDVRARRPAALVAQYAHALIGLGRIDEADRWLTEAAAHTNPRSWELSVIEFMRGMVCSARGEARRAAAHFLDCGRRSAAWKLDNPGFIPWRSYAALELVTVGEFDRARDLAAAELALARRWNTPRTLGVAWRAVALTGADARTLPLLERAVELLRSSETRTEFAPALMDLALACTASGRRERARELLEEARAFTIAGGAELFTARIDAHLAALRETSAGE